MMDRKHAGHPPRARLVTGAAIIAIIFGVITIAAGGSVLTGRDPGYGVYIPLLIFNTVMGFAYIGAGVLAWRSIRGGRRAAAAILLLNALVLIGIVYLNRSGAGVADDSVGAMGFRAGVWLVLFVTLTLAARDRRSAQA